MAIAVDATSDGSNNSASSLTISHTVSGDDRYLVVGVAMSEPSGATISSVTYNGVAMSLLKSQSSSAVAALYGLADPDTGTHDIVITLSAARRVFGGGISFTGVNQTNPTGSTAGAAGVGASASVTVNTSYDSGITVDFIVSRDTTMTADDGQTEYAAETLFIDNAKGGYVTYSGSSNPDMGYSWTGGDSQYALVAVEIQGGAATFTPRVMMF